MSAIGGGCPCNPVSHVAAGPLHGPSSVKGNLKQSGRVYGPALVGRPKEMPGTLVYKIIVVTW